MYKIFEACIHPYKPCNNVYTLEKEKMEILGECMQREWIFRFPSFSKSAFIALWKRIEMGKEYTKPVFSNDLHCANEHGKKIYGFLSLFSKINLVLIKVKSFSFPFSFPSCAHFSHWLILIAASLKTKIFFTKKNKHELKIRKMLKNKNYFQRCKKI